MLVQEAFVSINTTPDVVERYLTDPTLMSQWRSPLVMFEPIEGDLMTLGSTHKMCLKSLALAGATYTVAERDGGHILLRIEGLWYGTDLWRWWADGSRTVIQNRVEYEVSNEPLRVFTAGIGRLFATLDMNIQLERLRQLIEGPSKPAESRLQKISIEE